MDILNKLILTEITFEDYVKIHWGYSDFIGVSFLLDDNSVIDFNIDDEIDGTFFENEKDFLDGVYLDGVYFEEDEFIWNDLIIPGFPEIIKVHEWEW